MLKDASIGKPFFLSGGIEPDDVEQLKEFATLPVGKALFAIDINSKFEISPGVKDMGKVKEFVTRLNSRY
jgi:phosphoribosylanthranilate isomerase